MDAGCAIRVVLGHARVVVRHDVRSSVAVEVEDDDLVPSGDLIVDHAPLPPATRLGVDDHFVSVPGLDALIEDRLQAPPLGIRAFYGILSVGTERGGLSLMEADDVDKVEYYN